MAHVIHAMKTMKQLEALIGGLSAPSKMPCPSFNLPASKCITGGKLHAVKNSVCSTCYALKGRYGFASVQSALTRRFDILMAAQDSGRVIEDWANPFADLLNMKADKGLRFFRWHDSGDLQGPWHLEAIAHIARNVPRIAFWLPTRERAIVEQAFRAVRHVDLCTGTGYMEYENGPPINLTVRISAHMIDAEPVHIGDMLGNGPRSNGTPVDTGHGLIKPSYVFTEEKWKHYENLKTPPRIGSSRPPAGLPKIFACPSSLQGNACGSCRACWTDSRPVAYRVH